MKRSDWITICGMFMSVSITMIGGLVHLSYKIGEITEKVSSLEKNMESYMEKTDKSITEIGVDKEMKADISEIRIDMAEMKVKVDELWSYHPTQIKSSAKTQKTVFKTAGDPSSR